MVVWTKGTFPVERARTNLRAGGWGARGLSFESCIGDDHAFFDAESSGFSMHWGEVHGQATRTWK